MIPSSVTLVRKIVVQIQAAFFDSVKLSKIDGCCVFVVCFLFTRQFWDRLATDRLQICFQDIDFICVQVISRFFIHAHALHGECWIKGVCQHADCCNVVFDPVVVGCVKVIARIVPVGSTFSGPVRFRLLPHHQSPSLLLYFQTVCRLKMIDHVPPGRPASDLFYVPEEK